MSRVRVALIFSFNSKGFLDVLIENVETLLTQNMHSTQQSKIEFFSLSYFAQMKSQISQGRTSPFEADCIFIAARRAKWERKANKKLYKRLYFLTWLYKK